MEVKVTDDEIVVRLSKKDHKQLFDRVPVMRDVQASFEYLLDLDYQLNGDDGLLNGFPNVESFEESLKKMADEEIEKTKKDLLNDLYTYVNYTKDSVPEEYTFTMYDYDLIFIAENDTIAYLKYTADKLKALFAFIEQKGNQQWAIIMMIQPLEKV